MAAQPGTQLRRPDAKQGLPNHVVLCFLEDQSGFLWLGTQDGLYRYDGYACQVYRANPLDSNSLANGYIWDLHQTADGAVWAATFGGGLNRLDPLSGRFSHVRKGPEGLSSDRVFAVSEDGKGRLWLGTQNGLNRLDPTTGEVVVFGRVKSETVQTSIAHIGTVAEGPQGMIWFGGDSGLYRFDPHTESMEHFTRTPFGGADRLGRCYHLENDGEALLLSCRQGILRINPGQEEATWVIRAASISASGKVPLLRSAYPKKEGGYWVGTNQGLLSVSASAEGETIPTDLAWCRPDPTDPNSLPNGTVHAFCRTRDGVTWIGTQAGIAMLPQEKPVFRSLPFDASGHGPVNPSVTGLADGKDGRIFMATYAGLSAWDPVGDRWEHWPQKEQDKPWRNPYLLSVFLDRDSTLWIGSRGGGLHVLKKGDPAPRPVDGIGFDWSRTNIHAIHQDRDGMLWLGTGGSGLLRFDPRTDSVRAWPIGQDGLGPSHPYVFAIHEDRHRNLWLGTATGGLNLFDRRNERFFYLQNQPENPLSLGNDLILQLYEDRQNRLWISTAGGLHRFIPALIPDMARHWGGIADLSAQPWFLHYGSAEGFPSEVIYGVLEHSDGSFWVNTGKGLARFNPESGKVDRTADRVDGLPANEGMQNGFLLLPDGKMMFSTAAGTVLFHPDSVQPNTVPPRVVLTGVQWYNEAAGVGPSAEGHLTLPAVPERLETLRLGWQDDVIGFRFAAVHFLNPDENQCRYRLLGYDRDWLDAGPNRTATYTNLPGGQYTLEVMGWNADGMPAAEPLRLALWVQSPPWARWWAYVLYFILLAGLGLSFARWRVRRATRQLAFEAALEQARQEAQATFRQQSAEDFHDEAGSSITKINLFTALAKEEAKQSPALTDYLERIEQNNQKLRTGMRDFLWVMDSRHDSLYHTLQRFVFHAREECPVWDIKLEAPDLLDSWESIHLAMPVRRALLQGLKEALHNAIKHARPKLISLVVEAPTAGLESGTRRAPQSAVAETVSPSSAATAAKDYWTLRLCDDGQGFDPAQVSSEDRYGLAAQQARCQRAGVIWSVQSAVGKGTCVEFRFPAEA